MPTLFTYPSREKIQFSAEIVELKKESDRLKLEIRHLQKEVQYFTFTPKEILRARDQRLEISYCISKILNQSSGQLMNAQTDFYLS